MDWKEMNKQSDRIYQQEMKRLDRADNALKSIKSIMDKFGKEVDEYTGNK